MIPALGILIPVVIMTAPLPYKPLPEFAVRVMAVENAITAAETFYIKICLLESRLPVRIAQMESVGNATEPDLTAKLLSKYKQGPRSQVGAGPFC